MAGYVIWSNIDRLNMVRYLAVVVAFPDPDRPHEDAKVQCHVLPSQSDAVAWCARTVDHCAHEIAARGDRVTRTEMMG